MSRRIPAPSAPPSSVLAPWLKAERRAPIAEKPTPEPRPNAGPRLRRPVADDLHRAIRVNGDRFGNTAQQKPVDSVPPVRTYHD